jgi:hypothetical protein
MTFRVAIRPTPAAEPVCRWVVPMTLIRGYTNPRAYAQHAAEEMSESVSNPASEYESPGLDDLPPIIP